MKKRAKWRAFSLRVMPTVEQNHHDEEEDIATFPAVSPGKIVRTNDIRELRRAAEKGRAVAPATALAVLRSAAGELPGMTLSARK